MLLDRVIFNQTGTVCTVACEAVVYAPATRYFDNPVGPSLE